MRIQAAVLEQQDGDLRVADLTVDEPAAGEVLVRVVGTGICLSDLHGRAGVFGNPMPLILGHEGSGVVEAVGAGVAKVAPGDHVVMTVDSCGGCARCVSGSPMYCERFLELNLGDGTRPAGGTGYSRDGEAVHGRFCGQSSFATHTLLHERAVVKVPRDAPLEQLGPFGCAVQTGAGGVANVLRPRAGDSIAIYGVGSVGLCALMMAKVLGCGPIIAIDTRSERLDVASDLGATHLIDASADAGSVTDRVREATGGAGPRLAVDLTGTPEVVADAVLALAPQGRLALLGVPGAEPCAGLDMSDMLFHGKSVRGSIQGDAVPDVFIPGLIDLFMQGKLPVDRLFTRFAFSEINDAMHAVARGDVIKALVAVA